MRGSRLLFTREEGAQERIIPIDFLPRIISAGEWAFLERGLKQRLAALNLFLADIYGDRKILSDGVIPADLVLGCPQYRIQMRGVESPHGSYVSICGTDMIRTNDGFMVLEDNLRVPSGVSYMLANRQAVKNQPARPLPASIACIPLNLTANSCVKRLPKWHHLE